MDSSSPKYSHDAATASWDADEFPLGISDLMQNGAPEMVEQPSDPWQVPGGDPWTPAIATRSQFPRNYETRDFQPAGHNMDTFEPTWTLSQPDLRMLGVPVAGLGRPSVYAGGGSTYKSIKK